ncbi:MAG TPA: septum formation initiator family protein [Alphaproteobacteria bacterium]|nr:septum formation initiator family protein [Alphaproteobacteria bacterium]
MVSSFRSLRLSRRTLLPLIGFGLAAYFSWPLAQGERSWPRLIVLEHNISIEQANLDEVTQAREDLERKVVRLRPTSIDPDLLEERARALLGFQYPEEKMIISRP